jgi:hypothetical protein
LNSGSRPVKGGVRQRRQTTGDGAPPAAWRQERQADRSRAVALEQQTIVDLSKGTYDTDDRGDVTLVS